MRLAYASLPLCEEEQALRLFVADELIDAGVTPAYRGEDRRIGAASAPGAGANVHAAWMIQITAAGRSLPL